MEMNWITQPIQIEDDFHPEDPGQRPSVFVPAGCRAGSTVYDPASFCTCALWVRESIRQSALPASGKGPGGRYFDLECSYGSLRRRWAGQAGFAQQALDYGQGIRVLRQDPWEMLITFILSQRKRHRPFVPGWSCWQSVSGRWWIQVQSVCRCFRPRHSWNGGIDPAGLRPGVSYPVYPARSPGRGQRCAGPEVVGSAAGRNAAGKTDGNGWRRKKRWPTAWRCLVMDAQRWLPLMYGLPLQEAFLTGRTLSPSMEQRREFCSSISSIIKGMAEPGPTDGTSNGVHKNKCGSLTSAGRRHCSQDRRFVYLQRNKGEGPCELTPAVQQAHHSIQVGTHQHHCAAGNRKQYKAAQYSQPAGAALERPAQPGAGPGPGTPAGCGGCGQQRSCGKATCQRCPAQPSAQSPAQRTAGPASAVRRRSSPGPMRFPRSASVPAQWGLPAAFPPPKKEEGGLPGLR